jgi:hypothetical protein
MAGKSVTKNGAIPAECTVAALGRFETVAMQQGERRVLRAKRTLNSCFLCVDQLLKSAKSRRQADRVPVIQENPSQGWVF